MKFWDASAIVPLCLNQPATPTVRSLLESDAGMVVWWGSVVECWSAFARVRREGGLSPEGEDAARAVLEALRGAWVEILASNEVRNRSGRLMRVHPLRAADALQLSAGITWSREESGLSFVSFDENLGSAARLEGFAPEP